MADNYLTFAPSGKLRIITDEDLSEHILAYITEEQKKVAPKGKTLPYPFTMKGIRTAVIHDAIRKLPFFTAVQFRRVQVCLKQMATKSDVYQIHDHEFRAL